MQKKRLKPCQADHSDTLQNLGPSNDACASEHYGSECAATTGMASKFHQK